MRSVAGGVGHVSGSSRTLLTTWNIGMNADIARPLLRIPRGGATRNVTVRVATAPTVPTTRLDLVWLGCPIGALLDAVGEGGVVALPLPSTGSPLALSWLGTLAMCLSEGAGEVAGGVSGGGSRVAVDVSYCGLLRKDVRNVVDPGDHVEILVTSCGAPELLRICGALLTGFSMMVLE